MFMDVSVALTGPVIWLIVSGAGYRVAFGTTIVTTLVALALLVTHMAPAWRSRVQLSPAIAASS